MVRPTATLAVSAPSSFAPGSIVDEVYNEFSIRVSSIANFRPIWTIHITVDQVSFYIGAFGGIGMGYFLSQYDQPNIDNIDYYNQTHEEDNSPFMDLFNHVTSSPFHIIHRFFFSGFMYILIGLVTAGMVKQNSFTRPLVCGSLTGLYFTYGNPHSSFISSVKGTLGFAGFALLMEGIFYLAVR